MKRRNNTPKSLAQKALLAAGLTTAVSASKEVHAGASDIATSTAIDIQAALGVSAEQSDMSVDHQWGFAVNPNSNVVVTAVDVNSDANYYPDEIRVSADGGNTWSTVSVNGQTDLEVIGQSVSGTNLTVLFRDTSNGKMMSADFGTGGSLSNEVDFGTYTNSNGGGMDPLTGLAYGSAWNSGRTRITGHEFGDPSSPLSTPSEVFDSGSGDASFGYFVGESQPDVAYYYDMSSAQLKFVSDPFGSSPSTHSAGIGAVLHGVIPASVSGTHDYYLYQDPTTYEFKALVDPLSSPTTSSTNVAPTIELFDVDNNAVLDGDVYDHNINEGFSFSVKCEDSDDNSEDEGHLRAAATAHYYPDGVQLALTESTTSPASGGVQTVTYTYDAGLKFDTTGYVVIEGTCTDNLEWVYSEAQADVVINEMAEGSLSEGSYLLDVADSDQHAVLETQADGEVSVDGSEVTLAEEEGASFTVEDLRGMFAVQLPEGYTLQLSSTSGSHVDAQMLVFGGEAGAVAPPSGSDLMVQITAEDDTAWALVNASGEIVDQGTGDVDVLLPGTGEEEPEDTGNPGDPEVDETPEDNTPEDTAPRVVNKKAGDGGGCDVAGAAPAMSAAMLALAAVARRRED